MRRFAGAEEGRSALVELQRKGFLSIAARFQALSGARWHHLEARRTIDPVSGEPAILAQEQDIEARKKVEEDLRYAREDQIVNGAQALPHG